MESGTPGSRDAGQLRDEGFPTAAAWESFDFPPARMQIAPKCSCQLTAPAAYGSMNADPLGLPVSPEFRVAVFFVTSAL